MIDGSVHARQIASLKREGYKEGGVKLCFEILCMALPRLLEAGSKPHR